MRDLNRLYSELNKKVDKQYRENVDTIKDIIEVCYTADKDLKLYYDYFYSLGNWLLKLVEMEDKLSEDYFQNSSLQKLKEDNYNLFKDISGENYKRSYNNPEYAVSIFGLEMGQLLSAFYAKTRGKIESVYRHKRFDINYVLSEYIEAFNIVSQGDFHYKSLNKVMFPVTKERLIESNYFTRVERMSKKGSYYLAVIKNNSFKNIRDLFRMDKYISETEIKTIEFLAKYSKDKIRDFATRVVAAFERGFIVDNKNRGNRSVVQLFYNIGQETLVKECVEELEGKGFNVSVGVVTSSLINRQYNYDHRFDFGIYFNKENAKLDLEALSEAYEQAKDFMDECCGPLIFESFGETPFSPEKKLVAIKLTKEQQEIKNNYDRESGQLLEKFYPNENTNGAIVAMPSAEIGDRFEEIFEDTLKINSMDNNVYEPIQQKIIDILDKGQYIHVKGMGTNETDIKVRLNKLENPEKETNFVNCVADVNIPLGEVYTTPVLKGTEGVLHIKDIYLGLKYKDLKLYVKDGFVFDYSCSNFEEEDDNKAYVKENLMELNDKLPIGEFAIGTNTEAYMMAKKYDIIEMLPILIIEKMGPHFAIGDTCFSWIEDMPQYNILNNKAIVARDNEVSIKRKEDKNSAYTSVHTDITIPYEEIEFIKVVDYNGNETSIIEKGRFILVGTELLNKPFECLEKKVGD